MTEEREIFIKNERGIIYKDQVDDQLEVEVATIVAATEREIEQRREDYAEGLRELYEATERQISVSVMRFLVRTGGADD